MTDYQNAVEYVHSIGEWGSMKLGIERFAEFCARLGDPQEQFRSVHVAGTNGKGSTTAMIAGILQAAGRRVGAYYSPFVYDIRERFLLNGEMISEADFARLVERIRPVAESMEQTEHGHPTEFELKTALAFLWFAENDADFAVLEVGLGGRLDATNIVTPLVNVITNVSMDHMEHLGDTIAKIAAEKAGIIKPHGHCVTAADNPEALAVIRRTAEERASTLWYVHPDNGSFAITLVSAGDNPPLLLSGEGDNPPLLLSGEGDNPPLLLSGEGQGVRAPGYASRITIRGMHRTYQDLHVRMPGDFQHINAALAVGVAEALQEKGIDIPESAIRAGLESAHLPGRLEIVRENPTLIVDGAHNPDAAHKLVDAIREWFTYDRLILIMGMVKGHAVEETVGILAPLADQFIATAPSGPRAASASEVAEAARKRCPDVTIIEPVPDAVRTALESARENDLILVTGSFYTIGEVPR